MIIAFVVVVVVILCRISRKMRIQFFAAAVAVVVVVVVAGVLIYTHSGCNVTVIGANAVDVVDAVVVVVLLPH